MSASTYAALLWLCLPVTAACLLYGAGGFAANRRPPGLWPYRLIVWAAFGLAVVLLREVTV